MLEPADEKDPNAVDVELQDVVNSLSNRVAQLLVEIAKKDAFILGLQRERNVRLVADAKARAAVEELKKKAAAEAVDKAVDDLAKKAAEAAAADLKKSANGKALEAPKA